MTAKNPTRWRDHFRLTDTVGAAQIAARTTEDVITASEQLHLSVLTTIGFTPKGRFGWVHQGTRLIYAGVKMMPMATTALLQPIAKKLQDLNTGDSESTTIRKRAIAALNGVLGDQLADSYNPLATSFRLLKKSPQQHPRQAILLHGLCMDEDAWKHPQWQATLESSDLQPVYVRYNSGLPLIHNANLLLDALEKQHQPGTRYVIIGHSMGGLIAHLALQRAQAQASPLSTAVETLICLGSPHLGAPMAQLGHWIEEQLGQIRFTLPLTYVTRQRSAGIHDLKHGYPQQTPLSQTRLFLLAGEIEASTAITKRALGDGLVTVDSALGIRYATEAIVMKNTNHLGLLSDRRVWQQIEHWLAHD